MVELRWGEAATWAAISSLTASETTSGAPESSAFAARASGAPLSLSTAPELRSLPEEPKLPFFELRRMLARSPSAMSSETNTWQTEADRRRAE